VTIPKDDDGDDDDNLQSGVCELVRLSRKMIMVMMTTKTYRVAFVSWCDYPKI
jgi:hypothetical protein